MALEPAASAELDETRRTLSARSRRSFGAIPVELVIDHVLAFTPEGDFPVREAALEALERRMGFAARDGLVVATRPNGGAVLGAYGTTRSELGSGGEKRGKHGATAKKTKKGRKGEARPYSSWLESVNPPRGSCDCPDYLSSSLGLCKHLLVVLDDVHASPRRLEAARREQESARTSRRKWLAWDPRIPVAGALDRLAGLGWEAPTKNGASALPEGALDARSRKDPAARRDALRRLQAELTPRGLRAPRAEASPAARALLEGELARAERLLQCEQSAREVTAHLRGLKRKLYPYQREGIARFLRRGRLLLADDMGLGKTTQAIAACHALYRSGRVRRGVLIVPASLKPQWLREWEETTDVPVSVVDGPPDERAKAYRGLQSGFLIMNYEQLLRDAEHVQRLAPEIVVLDEAQRIKNYATKSAIYVKSLVPEYRLVLTGTPMENRLEELASILDWVDDLALAPKWRLVPWYTQWDGDGGRGKTGARHLDTLRARLSGCMLRRRRAEVLKQLPSRTDTRVPVEMTEQQRAAHDDLSQPIAQLIQISRKRPLTQAQFLKLMQLLTQQRIMSNGLGQLSFEELWPTYSRARPESALLEGLFAPKLLELRRLVADVVVAQERKVVVFSQWRRMLRLAEWSVRDILEEAGLRAVFFTGAERPAQRTRSVVDLHDDPSARVMFLTDAGGVGLNLQRAASSCINLELPWNPAVLEQRIGRIYRLGQERPIDVYNLVNEYGIESRIADLVSAKQALFTGLFDGTCDEVRFDAAASFLTRVERLLDPGVLPAAPLQPGAFEAAPTLAPAEDEEALFAAASTDGDSGDAIPGSAGELSPSMDPGGALASDGGAPAIAALMASLRVERTSTGGIRIDAPAEAAESLAALFAGMAKLISTTASGGP